MAVFDAALLAAIPHVSGLFGPIPSAFLVALAAFWGLAHRRLRSFEDSLAFNLPLFLAHFLLLAGFFYQNAAVVRRLGDAPALPVQLGLAAPMLLAA